MNTLTNYWHFVKKNNRSLFSYFPPIVETKGCSNVHRCRHDFCDMLASVPHVLCLFVSSATNYFFKLCSTFIFGILLASHVKFNGQSDYLLLDEPTISALFSKNHVLLLFSSISAK